MTKEKRTSPDRTVKVPVPKKFAVMKDGEQAGIFGGASEAVAIEKASAELGAGRYSAIAVA